FVEQVRALAHVRQILMNSREPCRGGLGMSCQARLNAGAELLEICDPLLGNTEMFSDARACRIAGKGILQAVGCICGLAESSLILLFFVSCVRDFVPPGVPHGSEPLDQ